MSRISNDYPFFLFFPFFLFLSLFSLVSLSPVAKCHSFASHSDSRRSHPALSSVFEIDAVTCRSSAYRRHRTTSSISIYTPIIVTSIAQTSTRFSPRPGISCFRPSPLLFRDSDSLALSLSDSFFLLLLSLSFYPPSFHSSLFFISSRRRRIITREPEFHFALIERSARRERRRFRR